MVCVASDVTECTVQKVDINVLKQGNAPSSVTQSTIQSSAPQQAQGMT